MKKKFAFITSGWSVDFVLSVINGLSHACDEENADLYIFTTYRFIEPDGTSNTTGFAIYDLIDFNSDFFDGIIFTPNLLNDDEKANDIYLKILNSNIPAVTLSAPLDGLHFISSDNHTPYKELIAHLITHHEIRDLAYIGGPEGNSGAESNYEAYKETLKEHNIPLDESKVFLNGDWSLDFGYQCGLKLFSDTTRPFPKGIVCVNDWAAIGVSKAATEMGLKASEDFKIIGFDDINYSSILIPSITTISINASKMGYEAIKLLIENPSVPTTRTVTAEPIFRQSCGCINKITAKQALYSQNYPDILEDSHRFTSQLRHLEDVFIEHETIDALSMNLQSYFEKRHRFEGDDFAILIKEEVIKNLNSSKTYDKASYTFGETERIIANIQNGKPTTRGTIKTKDLIPENMKDEEKSATYLFLPIFNQKYLHGYFVSKNTTKLLENKSAYNWTRNFGAIIEKFRQTLIYRTMSEQLRVLSTKDALSGLLNRAGLDSFAVELFQMNNDEKISTEILFVDINNMKIINDKFGHLHGDLAIKTVAEAIHNAIPLNYIAIRYGGDEFVVMGPAENSIDTSEKIREVLKTKTTNMSLPYEITVSIGSKIFAPSEKTYLLDAIKEVDEIMYDNKVAFHKSEGKN